MAASPWDIAQAGVFNPQTFTLDNGMRVVVIPNHRAPVVSHMVWYKVGAADEPPGKSGVAHFLEHLMFKG
ncbi:MAG: M16 family metallopeptidase, partial [Kiloniellales bacterium]